MVTACTSFISSRTQKVLNASFQKLGEATYDKPWIFLLCGVVLTAICGSGLLFMESESAIINLWVPQESDVFRDYQFMEQHYGTPASYITLILVGRDGANIMTPDALTEASAVQQLIHTFSTEYNDESYAYLDVCERVDVSTPYCTSDVLNLFALFFESNELYYTNEEYIAGVLNADGVENFAGAIQYGEDGTAIGANMLRMPHWLASTSDEEVKAIQLQFHYDVMEYWEEHQADYEHFDIIYLTEYSFDVEVDRAVTSDSIMFVIAFVVMTCYLMVTLGKLDCVHARVLLASTSIVVLICALIIGFGLAAYTGNKFSTLVFVVPFLLLGVGVDDMIIIVDSLHHTKLPGNDENFRAKQLGLALKHSGVSITLTSACSVIAFFAGSFSDLPGMTYFCVYAAWSFTANYFLQFLMFVPLLVWDNRRIQQKRNFCCCCVTHGRSNDEEEEEEEDEEEIDDPDAPPKKCSLNWFLSYTLIAALSHRIGRWIIIVVFVALTALSGYCVTLVPAVSDPAMLVPDDSHVVDYFDATERGWKGASPETFQIVLHDLDFSNSLVRSSIHDMMNAFEADASITGEVENWLEPFEQWLSDSKSVQIDSVTSSEFFAHLSEFEVESDFDHWQDELVFGYDEQGNPIEIVTTKFYFSAMRPEDNIDSYALRGYYNALLHQYVSPQSSFVFVTVWVYDYFVVITRSALLRNLISATAAVFLVLCLLMDLRLAVFIVLVIVGIDVTLMGWMFMTGTDIQIISFLQMCMAVGITVDYVIHMAHSIAEQKLDENAYAWRIKYAMVETGGSVLKGAATTFLGACVLAFAGTVAFRSFFVMLAGIIIVAVAFGLLFAPAVMGEFRWIYSGLGESEEPMRSHHVYAGVNVSQSQSETDNNAGGGK